MILIKEKSAYLKFCDESKGIPLFYQPHYLDAVCAPQAWDVVMCTNDEGKVLGIMPYHVKKKFGFSFSLTPQLTPYLGPFLLMPDDLIKSDRINAFRKAVYDELFNGLPTHLLAYKVLFHPQVTDWQSLMWRGYKQTTRYTYIIPSQLSESSIWGNFKSEVRNNIKNAEKKLMVTEITSVEDFYKICEQTYEKQKTQTPFTLDLIQRMYQQLKPRKEAMILGAKNESGEYDAAIMFVRDQKSIYSLVIGTSKVAHRGAVSLLMWSGIKIAAAEKLSFDFEGSDLPQIEHFFRSFGGIQTPYFSIQKAKNRVVEILLLLTGKF